ncbi:hypothetical protein HN018_02920 [Lichenicola cladoniae]|uniref:Uncharacterized protein n=1 Tax=Lichenicola cladoniae TaxID=1484109 RepID=A0A6M8HLD0_9PROT|nr:hypothetical protein [Lichenicola cladoniae]NPD68913.1 hypothetical protein [Acetobacteraceae bacterium]QKE89140.1 hypothetical protein HN018_02920 [Lichenicola cladoniae]
MSRTTRREVLGAGAFTAMFGIAAAAIAKPDVQVSAAVPLQPDGELIALCSRFDDLERKMEATYYLGPYSEAKELAAEAQQASLHAEQDELLEQITPIRATTLAGFQARARTLVFWNKEIERKGENGDWSNRMVWALVRDLNGGQA